MVVARYVVARLAWWMVCSAVIICCGVPPRCTVPDLLVSGLVWMWPPLFLMMMVASRWVISPLPLRVIGHPVDCPSVAKSRPMPAVTGRFGDRMAWGAQPRSRAWAASLVKAVGTSTLAGSLPAPPMVVFCS